MQKVSHNDIHAFNARCGVTLQKGKTGCAMWYPGHDGATPLSNPQKPTKIDGETIK